jgi:hypothetical protein
MGESLEPRNSRSAWAIKQDPISKAKQKHIQDGFKGA